MVRQILIFMGLVVQPQREKYHMKKTHVCISRMCSRHNTHVPWMSQVFICILHVATDTKACLSNALCAVYIFFY